jgi:electron transfer flavoprotein alpha/beta subunit
MPYKIVVCAKQVPDTNVIRIDPKTGTLIRQGVPSILNPDDANALEGALCLKDQYPGSTVTVVSMGPPQAKDVLYEAIAMGADKGVLLSDRVVGGSDTWATSNALAGTIRYLGDFDILLGGRQAIDGDTAQVGPQIAEKLGIPQVTYVEQIEIQKNGHTLWAKRQLEDGYELVEVKMPCMLTCVKELNEPRYMTYSGIFDENIEDKIVTISANDVGLDSSIVGLKASPTNVFRSFTPKTKGKGIILDGNSEKELVESLLVNLKAKHVI